MKNLMLIQVITLAFCFQLFGQWHSVNFPPDEDFFTGSFISDSTGWVVGINYVYKTTDKGQNWVQQISSKSGGQLIHALNDSTAFYANWGAVDGLQMTTDGGDTWTTVDSSEAYYTELEFVSDQVGYIAGQGNMELNIISGETIGDTSLVRKTIDGGKTWQTVAKNFTPGNYEIEGISFIDEIEGWAVSYDAYILHTVNGGINWEVQDSIGYNPGFELPLRDIEFVNSDSGWAVGGLSGRMLIARTIDGGENWTYEEFIGNSLQKVKFLNSKQGWTVGRGYEPFISETKDGGLTWTESTITPNLSGGQGFNSLSLTKDSTAWAIGTHLYFTSIKKLTGIEDQSIIKCPTNFELLANYPNPFNPVTHIPFKISLKTRVRISIFDIQGRELQVLIDDNLPAGNHEIEWKPSNYSSGIYICKMQVSGFVDSQKILLVK